MFSRVTLIRPVCLMLLCVMAWLPLRNQAETRDARGLQFIPFNSFSTFSRGCGSNESALILTSPEICARISWDELITSWNAELRAGDGLKVEARAIYPERATKWYTMALWATDPSRQPRTSVRQQRDADGDVDTDTLILNQTAEKVQVRATLITGGKRQPKLKFLSLSLLDSKAVRTPLPPSGEAWGRTIDVLERSQMAYENGSVLCSPTTISMLLAYWGSQLKRPGLDGDVPVVVAGVYDPAWGGTGNWVFNTAYAGSFRWMRAYTTRLSDVSELERFVARGIPVGLSLCYNRLRGNSRDPSGHLVVCVGFTKSGDVIINDPGTSENIRKVFPRANLVDAWGYSKNTVYLVYPVNTLLPKDEFGLWESRLARRRIRFQD